MDVLLLFASSRNEFAHRPSAMQNEVGRPRRALLDRVDQRAHASVLVFEHCEFSRTGLGSETDTLLSTSATSTTRIVVERPWLRIQSPKAGEVPPLSMRLAPH